VKASALFLPQLVKSQALSVTAPTGVLANDVAGSESHAAVVTGPEHGTLELAADGSFTYTPTAGFAGIDSFIYRATDADGAIGEQTALLYVLPTTGGATPTLDIAALAAEQQIAALYTGFFGRGADLDGYNYWTLQQ
jgi:hypothetical protein